MFMDAQSYTFSLQNILIVVKFYNPRTNIIKSAIFVVVYNVQIKMLTDC